MAGAFGCRQEFRGLECWVGWFNEDVRAEGFGVVVLRTSGLEGMGFIEVWIFFVGRSDAGTSRS